LLAVALAGGENADDAIAAAVKRMSAAIAAADSASASVAAIIAASEGVSQAAAAIIGPLYERAANDPRIGVSRRVSCEMQGIGMSQHILLERRGELHSYLDGAARRITTASIYARLTRLAIASNPVDGARVTVRHPPTQWRSSERPKRRPTPAELDGLRRGNERRHREALARKAAKAAAPA
jgi:hypothetical protein